MILRLRFPVMMMMTSFGALLGCISPPPSRESIAAVEHQQQATGISAQTCGITQATTVSGAGLGELQIGRLIEDIFRLCFVVADSIELDSEAAPQRVLIVQALGDSLRVLVDDDFRIWRLKIDSRVFRTVDSLGVGSSVREFLKDPAVEGLEGDGHLFLRTSRLCGISFRTTYLPDPVEHRTTWSVDDLRHLPIATTVDRVLLYACKR
jgi:hypothetical protein